MGTSFRLNAFLVVLLSGFIAPRIQSAEAIREVDLAISAVVYDPLTDKLYGAATNNLLQIDPDSGQVLRTFDLGSRIVRLELGAGGGIWAAVNNAVRRFNLETLAAEEPIDVPGDIFDLSPSQSEPYTVAVSTPRISGRWETGWLIKNGILLPDSIFGSYVAVNGNYFFRDNWRYPLGPNGIVNAGYFQTQAGGRMKPFEGLIYAENGWAFHANTLDLLEEGRGRVGGSMAINREENAVYYFADTGTAWALNRLEHPTGRHTGHHLFERREPLLNTTLTAWSTNRVAFHSATKLYLVDTTALFAPGDVAVLQTVRDDVKVGEDYEITVTVTNRGPGAALNLDFEQALSSGILRAAAPDVLQFRNALVTLEPGQSMELRLGIFATEALTATNRVTVSSSNDPDPANNTLALPITIARNTGQVVPLSFVATDVAYDPLHTRLFFTTGQSVWMFDPDQARFQEVTSWTGGQLAISDTGGLVWLLRAGRSERLDSGTFARTDAPGLTFPIHDAAISPTNPNSFAASDGGGTYLVNVSRLPNSIPEQGNIAFSPDGTRLYFLDAATCKLSVFRADPTAGLVLEQTRTNLPCGEFIVEGNFLYFNNGTIYDVNAGQRAAHSFNVTPPAFVLPRGGTHIDLLNRTNSAWVLRRLSATTLAPVATVPIDAAYGTPLEIVAMDPNTVAIRTTGGQILLVDLTDPSVLSASLSFSGGNQLTLSFFSTSGATYRVERTDNLLNPAWTTVRDNIAGTGARIDEALPTSPAPTSFYRVVRL